jgi:PBP1b-binding outer membrane lipoprotein LpoB
VKRQTVLIAILAMAFISEGCTTKAPYEPVKMPTDATMLKTKGQQATPEQAMTMMGPLMTKMMEIMMEALLTIMAKPLTAEQFATFTRNYYDAR